MVTVHSIGNKDCGEFKLNVWEGVAGEGRLLRSFRVEGLEAPNDLEPRRVTRVFDWNIPAEATLERPVQITVELDPADAYYEVTETNNLASRSFPEEPKPYMVPRMWKTLAAEYGLQSGDFFPDDMPKELIR